MKIRKAKISEAKKISQLIQNTQAKINAKDYSPKEIAAWQKANSEAEIRKRLKNKSCDVYLAIAGKEIVGTGTLDDSQLRGIFVRADQLGRHIGSQILRQIERKAISRGVKKLRLEASLTAPGFYQKFGYKKIKKSFHKFNGVKVRCVIMEKSLIR